MSTPATPHDAPIEAMLADLAGSGWHLGDALLERPLLTAVHRALVMEEGEANLQPAQTGRGRGRAQAGLRGDRTRRLEGGQEAAPTEELLAALDALRVTLNRRLFLGLEWLEAFVACYPPGAAYVRHRDRFRDDDARVLSVVIYLNPDWAGDAGGALRLHLADGPREVSPTLGHVVLFLSAEIEHEVLAATRPRWSVVGWFRRR